ncbi:MAG: trigger factor [Eubacteriaceae bacterium]|nr:trigger factor [Eubacteriaceae bacterium]
MIILNRNTDGNMMTVTLGIRRAEFDKALKDAYMENTDRYVVPGCAPGLASRKAIEEIYGSDALWEEALNAAVPRAFKRYLEDENISVLGKPEVLTVSEPGENGVTFSVRAELYPEAGPGEYKGIHVSIKREDNEEAFAMAVLKKACSEMNGDVSDTMVEMKLDSLTAKEMLNVSRDSIYHLLADTVEILSLAYQKTGISRPKEQVRREAMDIMLQTVSGSNEEPSVEYLSDQIIQLVRRYRTVPGDFDRIVSELFDQRRKKKAGMDPEELTDEAFGAYLGSIGTDEEKWREERRAEAAESARCDLLLDAAARKENISAEDAEADKIVSGIAEQCGMEPETVRKEIDIDAVRRQIMRDKAFRLIVDSAVGI